MTYDLSARTPLPASFQSMTMAGALRAAAAREPGKVAVRMGEETRSFADLTRRIDQAAYATAGALGLTKGQNAAILSRNCIEYVEIICGVAHAGVAVATVSSKLTVGEAVAVCDDAQARVLFVDDAWAGQVQVSDFATVRRIIVIGPEYEAWLQTGESPVPLPRVDEWDAWTIPYTSGTTGKPKGVVLSHRSRILNFAGMAAEYGCYGPDGAFLGITPMNHGAGVSFTLASLVFGGSLEIMDRFDPEAVLRKLASGAFTGIFMVPTHFHAIFALDPAILEACRRPAITTIISNAAPLPQAMKGRIIDYFGEGVLFECYGSTEASVVSNLRPPDQLRKQQCVGTPFAMTEVKLVDEAGEECGPDQVGELFSRSPYLFNGYWNRPRETEEAFRDGWVSVGDMARRDAEGYIHIVDRKKDMVISGGVNIYPREVEEVLFAHPAVAEAAVIGVPDDRWGERLKGFLVLAPGAACTAEDLAGFCEGRLAAYKTPREWVFIDALPRNSTGKVLKTALRSL